MRVDTIKKTIAWKSSLSGEMGRSIPIKDTKHGYKMCVYIKNVAGKVALRLYRFKAASEPLSEASAVNNQPTESKTAIATTTAETVQSAPAEKAANASDEDLKNDAQNQVSVVQRGPNEECYDDQKAEQAVRLNERFKTFPMGYYWTASDDHNLNKTHSACDEGSYSAYGAMVVDMHLPGIHEWSFDLETNGSCTGTGRIAVGIDEADAMALDQSFYTRKDTCNYAWLNSGHVCSQAKWDRYEPDTDTYTTQTSRLLMFVDAANKTIAWKSSRSNLGEIGAPIPIKSAEQGYRMCVSIQNGDDEVTIRTYQFTPASASRSQSETAEPAAESTGTAVEKRRCSAPLNSVKTVETIQPAPVDKAAHSVLNMADPALIQPSKCSVCNERGSKRCTGCNAVWYCSKEHQVIHWRSSHKHECKKRSAEPRRKTNTGGGKNATDAVRVAPSCGESVANDAVDSSDREWSTPSSGEEDGQKVPLAVVEAEDAASDDDLTDGQVFIVPQGADADLEADQLWYNDRDYKPKRNAKQAAVQALNELQIQLTQLEQRVTDKKAEMLQLSKEISAKKSLLATMKSEQNDFEQSNDELRQQNVQLKQDVLHKQAEISQVSTDISAKKADLEAMNAEQQGLQQNMEEVRLQIVQLNQSVTDKEADVSHLCKTITAKQVQVEAIEEEQHALEQKHEDMRLQNVQLNESSEALRKTNAELGAVKISLEAERESLQQEVQKLKGALLQHDEKECEPGTQLSQLARERGKDIRGDMQELTQAMNSFSANYSEQQLRTMPLDALMIDDELNAFERSVKSFGKFVGDTGTCVHSLTHPDVTQYKNWDVDQMCQWISLLHDGLFRPYLTVLRNGFESDCINGELLPLLTEVTLRNEPFKITNFGHRRMLLLAFQSLQQNINKPNAIETFNVKDDSLIEVEGVKTDGFYK